MRRSLSSIAAAIAAAACTLVAPRAGAQTPLEPGARVGPQFIQYRIEAPIALQISEMSVPLFAYVPITSAFTVDVGTAFASAEVKGIGGTGGKSTISGLTDTQVRGSYTFGTDAVVLSLGLNVPTGKSTVKTDEIMAAMLIGSDFFAFPVTSMGTGFGVTGGLAVARQVGSWNVGFGASMRRSAAYDPVDDGSGTSFRFEPGDEYRGRFGVDRLLGNGRLTMGLTYSAFTDDVLAGTTYNSGDRLIGQIGYAGTAGPGQLTLVVWDLYRSSGEIAGTKVGSDQLVNLLLAYGVRAGSAAMIEPSVEYRTWSQQDASSSGLLNLGLRSVLRLGPVSLTPAVRYSTGKYAFGTEKADFSGWHGILSIGLAR